MSLSDDRRAVCVLAVAAAVSVFPSCRRPVTADPNRVNEGPFGIVDVPRTGEVVGRMVDVAGWTLDDSGRAAVRVFVDGEYKASARITLPRPDVSKAFPKFANQGDVHGWRVSVDLGPAETPHTITVQVSDNEGATRDLNAVVVTVATR